MTDSATNEVSGATDCSLSSLRKTRLSIAWLDEILPRTTGDDEKLEWAVRCLAVRMEPGQTSVTVWDTCEYCKRDNYIRRLNTRGDVFDFCAAFDLPCDISDVHVPLSVENTCDLGY